MRRILLADWFAHGHLILTVFIAPSIILAFLPVEGRGAYMVIVPFALFLPALSLLREERFHGWTLMACVPQKRNAYIRRRFASFWVWFVLSMAWFLLVVSITYVVRELPVAPLFSWQAIVFVVFVFATFTGLMMPIVYRFGVGVAAIIASVVVITVFFGTGIGVFFLTRPGNEKGIYKLVMLFSAIHSFLTPVIFMSLLLGLVTAVHFGGMRLSQRIFARKEL
ncbi:MAG: ABC-2 transporter permease [Candidatus Cloacimonetes bacterium]|nr:ABC-2 transporter permease [Candidatus Cloacimonadota bacterium]